jgi:hypothetical protein
VRCQTIVHRSDFSQLEWKKVEFWGTLGVIENGYFVGWTIYYSIFFLAWTIRRTELIALKDVINDPLFVLQRNNKQVSKKKQVSLLARHFLLFSTFELCICTSLCLWKYGITFGTMIPTFDVNMWLNLKGFWLVVTFNLLTMNPNI